MAWHNERRGFLGLRTRFLGAGALLVLTTVAAAAWTLYVLSQLAAVAATTVREIDETTGITSAVSSALEREDDALLIVIGSEMGERTTLDTARRVTDQALARLQSDANYAAQLELAAAVRASIISYRAAVDSVVAGPEGALPQLYQRDANPLLRKAVDEVGRAREQRARKVRFATARARDEVKGARRVVVLIATFAVVIATIVALRLARHVILPMRQLVQCAQAIRDGNFEVQVKARPADEIGEVSEAFNEMTRRLAAFHRSNLGEVLRAKQALEVTLDALPDAVLLIDANGRVAATNPQADRLFAWAKLPTPSTAEDVARGLGADLPEFRRALDGQHAFDQVALQSSLRIRVHNDERRVMPRIVPLPPAEEPSGLVLVLSDVTQLAQLDEMRTELVAVASHELRTPLTTLRMSLLMLRELAGHMDARARDLVNTALGGVNLLGDTVDELLDMTQIESGRLKLGFDTVDVADLVREIARRNEPRADELGLKLDVHVAAKLPDLVGDRARLRIVLDNIVNNSLKYTPRGGSIEVRVTAPANGRRSSIQVAVTDSGCGIPAEYHSRVFEKFFRVEHHRPGSEDAPRGSGIGLYLCREIVELHGGNIRCVPPLQGPGIQMVLELPIRRDA